MRVIVWLAVAALAGCGARVGSITGEFEAAHRLLQSERYDLALQKVADGLGRAQKSADLKSEWRFRLLKAEILLAEREPQAALTVLRERQLPAGSAWREVQAKSLLLLGNAEYRVSHYAQAESLIAQAGEEARLSGSASLAAEVDLRRGALQVQQNRFADAEQTFRGVILAATRLHDPYLEASATGNLGYALMHSSRYDEAISWFQKAKALFVTLDARDSIARASGNLGSCYFRLGDFDNALAQFKAAESAFARTGNRYEQQVWLGNLANVSYAAGDYRSAAADYQKALAIARQLASQVPASQWLSNLAETYILLGDADRAETYNNEAISLKRQLNQGRLDVYSLEHAAQIAAMRRQFQTAEQLYLRALQEPADDPTETLGCRAELADLYAQTGRRTEAEREYEMALAGVNRLSSTLIKDDYKFSYLDSLIQFHKSYVHFLMANREPDRALRIAESSRSHVLAQRSGRPEPAAPRSAKVYQDLAREAHAVLLEYWLGQNQSYLWVITPGRIRNYRLPPAKTIHDLVEEYRRVVLAGRNPLESAAETGRKLYDILLAPAAEDLRPDCRVVIVPDQDLYSLSFESLPAGADSAHFWIENANVAVAPSLDYLADNRRLREARPGRGVLVMGDPAPVLKEYPKLEFAAREIDSIRSTMSDKAETVLRGPDARPDSYIRSGPERFRFIHFSAHAAANPRSPLDSAVILSGPPDRCKLFARDVMSVPLSAELVTISACRSAGARTYAGEGPVGLAWAFLRAGARNVIAGLWDVDDRSTAQLMSRLYAEIARGSAPGDALHAAKLSLLHAGGAYAKPFYWAPFQLYAGTL